MLGNITNCPRSYKKYKINMGDRIPSLYGPVSSIDSRYNNLERISPAQFAEMQPFLRSNNGKSPLILSKFYQNSGSDLFDYKFILSIDGVPAETIDQDSHNIYPNGPSNSDGYKFMRFLGVSDDIEIDTESGVYWHDCIYTGTSHIIVGNRGSNKILRSVNNGATWQRVGASLSNCCIYSITKFQDKLIAVGERWTEEVGGSSYYFDGDNNSFLSRDVDMATIFDEPFSGKFLVFTPTIHNNHYVILTSQDDGVSWNEVETAEIINPRKIITGQDKVIIFSGSGLSGIYSMDGLNWNSFNLPTSIRIYCAHYADNTYMALGIDNKENQVVLYSNDGINWSSSESPGGSWYGMDYIPKSGKFVACSLDGKICLIDKFGQSEIIYNEQSRCLYDILFIDNTICCLCGDGDEFRLLIGDWEGKNFCLKKTDKKSWHSMCHQNNSMMAVAYDGNDGASLFIHYLNNINTNSVVSINTRYYKNGIESYSMPENIVKQEDKFYSFKIQDNIYSKNEQSYKRSSIIYANNYGALTKYLIGLGNSYCNSNLPNNIIQGIQLLMATTPIPGDFIGTYDRDNKSIYTYLQACSSFLNDLNDYLLSKADINIPDFLKPFYGNLNNLTFDQFQVGEIVYQEDIVGDDNEDKFILGENGLIDMISNI